MRDQSGFRDQLFFSSLNEQNFYDAEESLKYMYVCLSMF